MQGQGSSSRGAEEELKFQTAKVESFVKSVLEPEKHLLQVAINYHKSLFDEYLKEGESDKLAKLHNSYIKDILDCPTKDKGWILVKTQETYDLNSFTTEKEALLKDHDYKMWFEFKSNQENEMNELLKMEKYTRWLNEWEERVTTEAKKLSMSIVENSSLLGFSNYLDDYCLHNSNPPLRTPGIKSDVDYIKKYKETIETIKARQIFDNRGFPTVEVDLRLSDGREVTASIPSGASSGVYEALDLRDGGLDYVSKSVLKAVKRVNSIIGPALIGKNPIWQTAIDNVMVEERDGSKKKGGWCKQELGANAILAVSIAVCKAGALVQDIPLYKHISNLAGNKNLVLPVPTVSVIDGGLHVGKQPVDKEYMILPVGASTFKEAMKMGVEVYHGLKSLMGKKYGLDATIIGDEGVFAPNMQGRFDAIMLLESAIDEAKYSGKVVIGIDAAASKCYQSDKTYDDGFERYSGDEVKDLYKSLVELHPIVSIKDPFDQNDCEHYSSLTAECGRKLQIVGDDLLVTDPKTLAKAIEEKWCNALPLKVNQIGSLTEIIQLVNMSKNAGWSVVASQSGETEDTFIADLCVGLGTGQIKSGAPCGSERLANYNQLLRIEEEIGSNAVYVGANFRAQ